MDVASQSNDRDVEGTDPCSGIVGTLCPARTVAALRINLKTWGFQALHGCLHAFMVVVGRHFTFLLIVVWWEIPA